MNRLLIGSKDKTDLILQLMRDDLADGFLLIDPTGELAEAAVNTIPKSLIQRTFYFDVTDANHAAGFNVLNNVPDDKRHTTISTFKTVLNILYSEGANTLTRLRANHLLTTALTNLLSKSDTTLLHVVEELTDTFPNWDKKDKASSVLDIETRLGDLLAFPLLRNIVGQPRTTFSLEAGKIVIVNLDRAEVGDLTAKFLGLLLATHAKNHVYLNDIDFFATDYLATLFPRNNFTVAARFLPDKNRYPDLRQALLGFDDIRTFQVSTRDADELIFPLGKMNPRELVDSNAVADPPHYYNHMKAIRKRSRACHTRPRAQVERLLGGLRH
jgi:hypothetical protein